MHWQDPVLTAAQAVFIVALFPSILSKDKPALATSLMNGAVTAGIALVYISLFLWFAAITAAINSMLWLVLAAQKYGMDRGMK
jgi:hypothetical protein